jgi:periplasmic divalent cation tolerance protein
MPFAPRLIFVTASNLDEARAIARAVLEKKLAACVNILPGIESHYWWQGQLESAPEVMLIIKTSAGQFEPLAALVKEKHSYACPEIVAVPPGEIAPAYRQWWENNCSGSP